MILMILTWTLLGLLLGVSGYVVFPALLAFLGGGDLRRRFGSWYIDKATTLIGSSALVAKTTGGVEFRSTEDDPKFEADRVTVDGEDGHLRDPFGLKGYLSGQEFGIGINDAPTYISPLLAELGAAAAKAKHRDRVGPQPDGGIRLDFEIPKTEQLPDLNRAAHLLEGNADLRDGIVAEKWARYSQEKFHQKLGIRDTLLMIFAFAAGVLLALMISRYGGSGGGTTVPVQVVGGALL
jgi:hypothetical protein